MIKLKVSSPLVRLAKKTSYLSGTARKPGNRMGYTIWFDNDGTDTTRDTSFIVDYLPTGVAFICTTSVIPGRAGLGIKTYVQYNGAWLNHLPDTSTRLGMDSLFRVTAVRFAIAPGIAKQNGTDLTTSLTADDSTDVDAGMIKYRVKIR